MKRIMMAAAGTAAMLACAVTVPEKTPEERRAEMEKFGGYVKRPGNGKSVLLADMRGEKTDDELLKGFAKGGAAIMHLTFDLKAAKPPTGKDIGEAARQLKDASHPAVVAVADVPGAPTLGIFPEDSVAFVNVAPLKTNDETRYKARVTKELWRAAGFALGAYVLPRQGCVMEAVHSVGELDSLPARQLSPMRFMNVYRAVEKLGIPDGREVPYVKALREGWAPAPTNDAQRAAVRKWEEVKAKRAEKEAAKRKGAAGGK